MSVLQSFLKKFRRHKAFVIDDSGNLESGVARIESHNISTEGFSDYKNLLYKLNKKKCKYSYGMIYENGSKYKPQIICNFIRQINPDITLFIYKNQAELNQHARCLPLT